MSSPWPATITVEFTAEQFRTLSDLLWHEIDATEAAGDPFMVDYLATLQTLSDLIHSYDPTYQALLDKVVATGVPGPEGPSDPAWLRTLLAGYVPDDEKPSPSTF